MERFNGMRADKRKDIEGEAPRFNQPEKEGLRQPRAQSAMWFRYNLEYIFKRR